MRNKPIRGNNRDYIKVSDDGTEAIIEYTDMHGNKRIKKEKLKHLSGNKKLTPENIYKVTE